MEENESRLNSYNIEEFIDWRKFHVDFKFHYLYKTKLFASRKCIPLI
jgi:predicted AlkP superfamily pyrophosphatase or phosphodiesterase